MNSIVERIKAWLKNNNTPVVAVVVTLAFMIFNAVMLTKDFYLLIGIPLLGLLLMLFVFKFETGLMATALFPPFAIDFALVPQMELSMPVEPMMILLRMKKKFVQQ